MKMADFLDINNAWGEGTLQDWYMNSIDNTIPPIWTEEHISELCNDFYVIPREIPTADVTPVVHGYWLYIAVDIYGVCREFAKQCSICGSEFPVSFWENNSFNFCPNCGAKMDGDENEP